MVNLICPVCQNNLVKYDKSYMCSNKHNFDISSSGYTNLLLANKKKSLSPGDNKIMSDARHKFLTKEYFFILSENINRIITDMLPENSTILDCGCGSGYYLDKIEKMDKNYILSGIDISKYAIEIASKQNKNINYFVSSIFSMPFTDNSFDMILNIFAPKAEDEIKRILHKNGYILEVVPGENHLIEIKKTIYDNYYLNKPAHNFNEFKLLFSKNITYKKCVENEDLISLIKMTPYFYKTKKEDFEKILILNNFELTFDFTLNLFQKY